MSFRKSINLLNDRQYSTNNKLKTDNKLYLNKLEKLSNENKQIISSMNDCFNLVSNSSLSTEPTSERDTKEFDINTFSKFRNKLIEKNKE